MTDDKKPSDDKGELDWEQALSEWENTSFVPEVAKEVATDKPATLAGATRPLYRPPTVSPAVRPKPLAPVPVKMWSPEIDDDEMDATRIARVPQELLRDHEGGPKASSHGGLAQLFESPARLPASTLPTGSRRAPATEPDEIDDPIDLILRESEAPRAPALLIPEQRHYDPNEVTGVGSEADLAQMRAPGLAEPSEQPPQMRTEESLTLRPPIDRPPLPLARTWPDEKPASAWLSAAARETLEVRAEWLEEEARSLQDAMGRARGLLACSEILATLGDRERAQALAAEARDGAPALALAHRQARALMPSSPSSREDYVEALDAEETGSPAGPVRVHSALLAAEMMRVAGHDEAASERFENAARIPTADVRAAVARAAHALARDETANAALHLPDAPELAPVAEAIATCLRLRGVERDGTLADTQRSLHLEAAPDEPRRGPGDAGASANGRLPAETLLLARQAVDRGQIAEAALRVAELAVLPELAPAAKWLAASLGAAHATRRADSARWLHELAERGDEQARRALVARALELGDTERLTETIGTHGPLTSSERVTIATLAGLPLSATDPHLDATASTPGMETLAAALTALAMPTEGDRDAQIRARALRTAGLPNTRSLVSLARLLASSAAPADIEAALEGAGVGHAAQVRAVALEMAARAGRTAEVSSALEAWGAGWGSREEGAIGALAAALVAERAGNRARALEAFKAARTADPTNEAALRAIASLESIDLVAEMNELADELAEGPRAAIARIEAVARAEGMLPEPTRAHMLDQAHVAAPGLPIASFLAERIARRAGDVEEVLRWVRERRAGSSDVVEAALDAVREALLIADREPLLAGERLGEAHRARPSDMALRELYERMSSESPEARASWREQRATEANGDGRTLLLLEAAREFERAGDDDAALRCAEAAGANDASLGGIARERAELRARRVTRLAEELLSAAKAAGDARSRREAYERLATVDALRHDSASALLWHRSILEELPQHEPSLRHVEHHLIGEGRDDELEPIATAIAIALRGTGPGECTAHAELAARLRLRAVDSRWDSTRDMVELAAAEGEPSLWSLRMLQAHARARGDDDAFLAVTQRLLDRASRPAETAALLVLAGEAASRLGRLEEARSLLERASAEDPGDIVAWTLLFEVRRRAGDGRGAAEACEALARSSVVREYQLLAWYDSGRLWLDEAKDEERAVVAFEAAAAIDIAHKDVFDRLSHLYVSRKMQPELASLLERRVSGITDPDERLAMEVRRGRVLLEAADTDGARRAFEAALAERPDDPGALSALADLCVSQSDWEAAERALVRLARLLPTAEEQRHAYARLGDLYAHHLLNLSRAEVALKEVLKRAPDNVESIEKLVDVYKRQNDAARAAELQQELIAKARSPEEKRARILEQATIHEQTAHDNRRAEQTLEAARREFPLDVGVLRAIAEFYTRHHQAPAVNILLDRAGGDARRALASGRVSPAIFELLGAVFDLRDKKDAAGVARAMLAALDGQPAEISGAGYRAFDTKLDDRLAPEGLTAPFRALLAKTGDALDQVSPVDLRALRAAFLPADAPLARLTASVGQAIGLGAVQVLVSAKLGAACIPVGSSPPVIVVGEALPGNGRFAEFLVLRALKLVHARASVFARAAPSDLAILVSAWLKCFNPTWQPQGVNPALLNAAGGRLQSALPRNLDPDVALIALEAAGTIGTQAGTLGALAIAWADRVALLSLGDPNAALDAIAASGGAAAGAPRDPKERAAWIARTPEARDLIAYAVSDAFADIRARLSL
jgi:tetratricopeptide (TPR) repeat protein